MTSPEKKNKVGRPQRYVFWSDWEAWLLKEWYPFKSNDLIHMQDDITWLKRLMVGLLFVFVAGVIAIVTALVL